MRIIAIDLGGTKISFGIVEDEIVKESYVVPTEAYKGPKYVISKLVEIIKRLDDGNINGVGIGSPGPLDYRTGTVLTTPNLSKWNNIKLKKILEKKTNLSIKIDNDAHVFALGERKSENMVVLTLGTGIGAGVIIDNKIYHGHQFASELGHMIISADGRAGNEGIKGSFENYCSGTAIEQRFFEKYGIRKSMLEIAKMKDKESKEIINETAHYLAIALNNIKNIFDPEIIVLGGSLTNIKYMIKKSVREMNKMPFKSKVKVIISKNKNSALIGAYRLFL
jgi:glucokinase